MLDEIPLEFNVSGKNRVHNLPLPRLVVSPSHVYSFILDRDPRRTDVVGSTSSILLDMKYESDTTPKKEKIPGGGGTTSRQSWRWRWPWVSTLLSGTGQNDVVENKTSWKMGLKVQTTTTLTVWCRMVCWRFAFSMWMRTFTGWTQRLPGSRLPHLLRSVWRSDAWLKSNLNLTFFVFC